MPTSYLSNFEKLESLLSSQSQEHPNFKCSFSGESASVFEGVRNRQSSNGWLGCWKIRHSNKGLKLCGESVSVDDECIENYKQHLPDMVKDYNLEDMFNCDETGLYYRALPDKVLSVKGLPCKRTKQNLQYRVTVHVVQLERSSVLSSFLNRPSQGV